MQYRIRNLYVKQLIDLIAEDKIDLKPYYQRNDIWMRSDQELLIDSITRGFPLPSFFIYNRPKSKLEMVDGQQRARTIFRFYQGHITNSQKLLFEQIDKNEFLNYVLSVTELYDINDDTEIEEFYVVVNKRGKHLTTPEIHKAQFAHTNFLHLAEELLTLQSFMNLNLFTQAASRRMSDRNFIEELLAYLLYGVQDKKKVIELIYSEDINVDKLKELRQQFSDIIMKIEYLNQHYAVNQTRYRQRNDFYTMFNFIHENINLRNKVLLHQYKILRTLDKHISPSNMRCAALREYALNCVSQSNSKRARQARLKFWRAVLLNKESDISKNEILADVANYIDDENMFNVEFDELDGFYLLKV